jgi:hypothetical protein
MKNIKQLTKDVLRQFTGTETWYRHGFARDVLYTDGVRHVAENAEADWLLDEIVLAQKFDQCLAEEAFQVWTLKVNEDRTATLTCEDGNLNAVYHKEIEYTDFPLDQITLWFTNNVILLPSEY